MPTYEYHCEKCGLNFDVEQRMIDDALTVHEGCGGAVVKVFSSAGIVLKGSGFYKTDARSQSVASKGAAKKDNSGSNSDKKSETPAPPKKDSSTPATDKKPSSSPKKSS